MTDGNKRRADYRQHRFSLPPGASELILVRHGESAPASFNDLAPLVKGRSDPPLAPEGHRQAELVAQRLASDDIAAIYVSNLCRAAETAAPVAGPLGLQPITEPGLTAACLGE